MTRRIALVKPKRKAFAAGILAEQVDPTQQKAATFDSFIVTQPGVPAEKVLEDILDEIQVLFHLYSNLQGKIIINNSVNG